jgi:propanediol dehydratase large subunit
MRVPAEQFLMLRAYGAPPIVIALAAQGTFRGFKDTKTPLYAVGMYKLATFSLTSTQTGIWYVLYQMSSLIAMITSI